MSRRRAAPPEGVVKSLYERIKTGPKHFWAAVGLQISLDVLFSLAFLIIAAARVMIWYSLNVLWSAILGCALLGDVLPRRTIVTCIFALGCIAMVFGPELATKKGREGSPWGDLAAIYVGVAVAVYLIIVRHAARERPRVPITFATTVGALAAFVLVSLSTLVTGDCIVPKVSSPGLFYLCMALDGFAIAGIFVAFSIAPRYITGAEVSLCSLLETVLGPLWVFLIYNEKPGPFTLAGRPATDRGPLRPRIAGRARGRTTARARAARRRRVAAGHGGDHRGRQVARLDAGRVVGALGRHRRRRAVRSTLGEDSLRGRGHVRLGLLRGRQLRLTLRVGGHAGDAV